MLIVTKKNVNEAALQQLTELLSSLQIEFSVWIYDNSYMLGLNRSLNRDEIEQIEQLNSIKEIRQEECRRQKKDAMSIEIKGKVISQNKFVVIAGPCTIENEKQMEDNASALKGLNINFIRGGAFKLRSSSYSFQGIGKEALLYMKAKADKYDLISVSEITTIAQIEEMSRYIDILLVGTRNMQNYPLLSALGESGKIVILKRGMANTISEWIAASEYISRKGNNNIIMCERGIRSFEKSTRNTLDISAVPIVKKETGYPVIVDPSHSSGKAELIKPLSWAAAAAGADGLMIECDIEPCQAKCDARQIISIPELKEILRPLAQIIQIWDKELG